MSARWSYAVWVGGMLLACLALRVIDPHPIARLRLQVFDFYHQLKPRQFDPAVPVRIVDIDERSLREVGQWPWPRSILARLVQRLTEAGAIVIGFDVMFPEPGRATPEDLLASLPANGTLQAARQRLLAGPLDLGDVQFAAALQGTRVVLGFMGSADGVPLAASAPQPVERGVPDTTIYAPTFQGAIASLPRLQLAATSAGAMNWLPEHDQIVRRLPLLVVVGDDVRPSLAAELLRLGQSPTARIVVVPAGARNGIAEVRIGNAIVPTDASGQIWLKPTHSDRRRYLSAAGVLDGTVPRSEIEGRIILIGTSAAGLLDLRTSSLEASIPGVEMHAQAIEQMALGTYLMRPDYAAGLELIVLAAGGLSLAVLVASLRPVWGVTVGIAATIGFGTASWLAFSRAGYLLDPVYPGLSLAAIFAVAATQLYRSAESDRARILGAFGHYVSSSVIDQLAADPQRLTLGGETREITVLFCDVRGFTGISERLDAAELTRFLNRLLTPLSDAVLETRGTIDKYMGDAIMAFWNAPLDDTEHAANACRAALAMMQALDGLNAEWAAEAEARGEAHTPVAIGIGIATGLCCVGNLGTERRFDYSVIGDNVNVAARLQNQTKQLGTPILVAASTAAAAPAFALLPVADVDLKGKSGPVTAIALLGDPAAADGAAFRRLSDAFLAYRAAAAVGHADNARARLDEVRELGGAPMAELCRKLAAQPLPKPADRAESG